MNQEKIGKFILECRKSKKLTQFELAEKLGVTDKSISNWENGRNMPDLSLFKPLCEILDISINDLISGEKVSKDKYQEKLEENIISTIDYTNKKVSEKNNLIGIILITFGILLAITAMTIFPSESSWGSVYSVIGVIMSLVGVSKFTRKLNYAKRLLFNFGYFIIFLIVLFIIDYISVVNINQAPRFSTVKMTADTAIYYDTPFYDVIRCNKDTEDEYFKVMKNQSYDENNIQKYCK
ncbi:MAG: helix-turn-helix domain-containing protein [Lactobacillales bacterium]|nr:helix-turn-helix domain-containing protein [Lactobacillales bacterium]